MQTFTPTRTSALRSSTKLSQEFIQNSSPLGNKEGMRERGTKQHGRHRLRAEYILQGVSRGAAILYMVCS